MDDHKSVQPARRREDKPKTNIGDDLPRRIAGLEKARSEPGMTPADIAALNRSIAKLKEKLAEKIPKPEQENL
jgi:hypothetical protein